MLKWRLISAAIMVPLVVYGVLRLSTPAFAAVLGAILVAAIWEWSRLVPLSGYPARIVYTAAIPCLLALTWLLGPSELVVYLLAAAGAWWLFALYWL
ncbi:MAG: phosphatidate cytidylyltransferase, partial [Gammaproteobacteria bacterium]